MTTVRVKAQDRVAFVGATGSGKTQLAKYFLSTQDRVLVLDPKHTFKMDGFKKGWSLPSFSTKFRTIVRPRLQDDEKLFDLLHKTFKLGNVTIYCDEMATLSDMFKWTTIKLEDIARTGRERKVSLWSVMQRPRGTPRVFLTETDVFFVFNLRSGEDRDYIRDYVGNEVEERIPKYKFWYIRPEESTPSLLTLNLDKNRIETSLVNGG